MAVLVYWYCVRDQFKDRQSVQEGKSDVDDCLDTHGGGNHFQHDNHVLGMQKTLCGILYLT